MGQNSNGYDKNRMVPDDSFFTAIGKAAEEEMLKECELWEKETGDVRVPEKAEAQILALARKLEKKHRNKRRDHLIRRYVKAAAVAVILICVSFTALLAGADALRGKFFDFILQDSDAYTKVIPVETSDPGAQTGKNLPSYWKEVYYPDYLPEGYRFAETNEAGTSKTIIFENGQMETLVLTQEPSDGAEILVDKDGVESGETSVQGNPAFWTDKEGAFTLMWNEYGILFMLYGPLNLEEMTRVAEHLLYVK